MSHYNAICHRAEAWPTEKPPAFLTIDDRAVQFNGTWPDAKFTDQDVARIRRAVAKGSKRVDIARTYGVHRGTIERICLKQTWGHVR